jgi:hypothetical protein
LSSRITIGQSWCAFWKCTTVESSMPVIWNAPSPTTTIGRLVGRASCTPIAAGTPKPSDR